MSVLGALKELEKTAKVSRTAAEVQKTKIVKPVITKPIQGPKTPVGWTPPKEKNLLDALKDYISPEAQKARKEAFNRELLGTKVADKVGKFDASQPTPADALVYGALKTSSFGLAPRLLPNVDVQRGEKSLEKFPGQGAVGKTLGYIGPSAAGAKLVQPLIKPMSAAGKPLLARATEGAIVGTGITGLESTVPVLTGEKTLKETGKDVIKGLATGAIIDSAFYGLGRLSKPIISKLASGAALSNIERQAFKEAMNITDEQIDNMARNSKPVAEKVLKDPGLIQRELKLSEDTTAQSFMREQERVAKDVGAEKYYQDIEKQFGKPEQVVKPLVKPAPEIKKPSQITMPLAKDKPIVESLIVPIKEVGVQVDDISKQNYRKTIHKSMASENIPEEIRAYYKENPSLYEKVTNAETWDKAYEKVSQDFEGAVNKFIAKESLETADDTAEAIAALHKTFGSGNISESIRLADSLAEKATRSGQAIQALVMLQRGTPEGKLLQASTVIKNINKKLEEETPSMFNKLKEKGKLPTLTEDEATFIKETMERAQDASEDVKRKLIAQIDQMLSDKIPATFGDKIRALRNLSLLGNPKTLIRNPLGNLIFTGLENISQIPSGITDKAVSALLKTERTTKVLPSLKTQTKGFKKGVDYAIEDIINNVDTSPTRGGMELPRSRKVFETAWLNKPNNWLGDALKMGDRPFYQAAYDARLKELIDLRPNADVKDLEKLASDFALERTFQNESDTAKAVAAIKKGMNKLNLKGFGLGDIVMPYTQTPSNILAKGAQYTPLNIIYMSKLAFGGGGVKGNQKEFVDAAGRLFTGTGLATLGYLLSKEGTITSGSRSDSTKERDLKRQAGIQDFSIKIGDKWYSYDWAQPAAIPIAVGAAMQQAGLDESDALSKITKGVTSGTDTLLNQSMLQGITRMFSAKSPSEGIIRTVTTSPTQFVPTLLSQTAQFADPYKRDIDYSGALPELKTTAQRKTPVIRQTLPKTIDMFGQPVKEMSGKTGLSKALNVFLNPTKVTEVPKDKTTQEILRLFTETKESDVIPSKMPTGLTADQEREFKTTFGQLVKPKLDEVINSGMYQNAPEDTKADIVSKIIESAYKESKQKLGIGKK